MTSKNTTHSVNFNDDGTLMFDFVVSKRFLSLVFPERLEDFFIYEPGFPDASSNAEAILEVPLENFQDLFRVKITKQNVQYVDFEYFVDHTKWNFNHIAQNEIAFSNAIVQPYDGSLNKGPIRESHHIQTLKRDLARHVFAAIPNIERLNNLQIFQNRIVSMIEEMDSSFHLKILETLEALTQKGYRNYHDLSDNPIKVLVATTFNENPNIGVDQNDTYASESMEKSNVFTQTVNNAIEKHVRTISQYVYYVDSSNQDGISTDYFGPLFLTKETALMTSFALNRFVNFELQTIDSAELLELRFDEYPDYVFYGIPGANYNQGSYTSYTDISDLDTNIELIRRLDIWKGNFVHYVDIIFSYPFEDGDQLSLLLTYQPDNLNFQIFNETFGNFANNIVEPRIYQIFLKMKQTKVIQSTPLSFVSVLLSILRNDTYHVKTIIDLVRIRIELEIKIYHKNVNTLTENEQTIIEELKNTTSLPYILIAVQNWQYWYKNWYLIGNPIQERQVVLSNIQSAKTEITTLNQTAHIIDFLLDNVE
jgi:hypothetical protein